MTIGPLTVSAVMPNEIYRDVQIIQFEETLFYINMPPIEYTIKPGDTITVDSNEGHVVHPTDAIKQVRINDGPKIDMNSLWEQHWQTHPRLWLGER